METLILLHGAIGAPYQLQTLAGALQNRYNIHTLAFSGHGGRGFPDEPFSIRLFANEVLAYMNEQNLEQVSVFGYSMGGYVGVYLALHHPDRISKVITLATKYLWDESIAAKEVQMLNPEKIEQKLPAFAATLQERHAPNDWKQVLKLTADMMLDMGRENPLKEAVFAAISAPVLVLLGDRDKMVTLDETIATYKALANAQMGMLPNTGHPIEQVDTTMLQQLIAQFVG